MSRRCQAQIGLFAFVVVLAISLVTVVSGWLSPSYLRALAVGDRVPDFALPDETGVIQDFASIRKGYVMLVYAPAAGLTDQQTRRIGELRQELERAAPLHTVAVLADTHDDQCRKAHQLCNVVLLDSNQTLWPIRAARDGDAAVCLLDRYGYVKLRAELPPAEPIAADPVQRPILRLAISTITAGALGH